MLRICGRKLNDAAICSGLQSDKRSETNSANGRRILRQTPTRLKESALRRRSGRSDGSSGSSRLLTGEIVHELLVLLREFEQPSAGARLRFHHRDFSEALNLLAVAVSSVMFR